MVLIIQTLIKLIKSKLILKVIKIIIILIFIDIQIYSSILKNLIKI